MEMAVVNLRACASNNSTIFHDRKKTKRTDFMTTATHAETLQEFQQRAVRSSLKQWGISETPERIEQLIEARDDTLRYHQLLRQFVQEENGISTGAGTGSVSLLESDRSRFRPVKTWEEMKAKPFRTPKELKELKEQEEQDPPAGWEHLFNKNSAGEVIRPNLPRRL